MNTIISSIQTSFSNDLVQYQKRIDANTQPIFQNEVLPLDSFDFFNNQNLVGIVYANIGYFIIVGILMTIMKMEGMEAFDMKNFMRVYNLVCVCLAGYVVVGVINTK